MPNFNSPGHLKSQYRRAENLNTRILLHQRYSTNKQGWGNWVFENYALKPGQTILELGCGSGGMWRGKAGKLPEGLTLVLSDLSVGMLETARENTREMDFIEYCVMDAQNIPFADGTLDIVIANHMLYHVPDIRKALSEISRVLKPDGTLYATTVGENNMKTLVALVEGFDPAIDFAMDSVISAFGLESGELLLREFFGTVDVRRYEDSLHITEPQPLIDYILSSTGIGNVGDIVTGDNIARFDAYITALFAETGSIDIKKDAGILIAKKQR